MTVTDDVMAHSDRLRPIVGFIVRTRDFGAEALSTAACSQSVGVITQTSLSRLSEPRLRAGSTSPRPTAVPPVLVAGPASSLLPPESGGTGARSASTDRSLPQPKEKQT